MKRTKFLVFGLAISALLIMGMGPCAENDPAAKAPPPGSNSNQTKVPPQPPKRVYDQRHGVAIMVPADWIIARKQANPVLFATAPDAGDNGPLVNLVVENISQRMAAFDYLMANAITMQLSLPGLEVKQQGVEPVGDSSTAWIHFTYPRDGQQVEAVSYCQTKDYRAYVVTALAPAEDFSKYEALFRTIGRSLAID